MNLARLIVTVENGNQIVAQSLAVYNLGVVGRNLGQVLLTLVGKLALFNEIV